MQKQKKIIYLYNLLKNYCAGEFAIFQRNYYQRAKRDDGRNGA